MSGRPAGARRASSSSLEALLAHPALWRGDRLAGVARASLASGFGVLDASLPGGGWKGGALTEILTDRQGIGEVSLLLPALARLTRDGGAVAWVAAPHLPYAPALAQAGVEPARCLVVRPGSQPDALWAAEQALRSGACAAVLLWTTTGEARWLRRLQLAADAGGALGVLYRGESALAQASPAALRLLLEPAAGALRVRILKRRGVPASAPLTVQPHPRIAAAAARLDSELLLPAAAARRVLRLAAAPAPRAASHTH